MSVFSAKAQAILDQLEASQKPKDAENIRLQALKDIETGKFAQDFAAWVQGYARTEKDVKVIVNDWVNDWNLINGDLRLNEVVISGAAQVYKSLGSYLLSYYATQKANFNCLYTFAKSTIRDKLVSSTVKPLYEANNEANTNKQEVLVDNNKVYRTPGSILYTSFLFNPSIGDAVAVPPEIASISVDIILIDEFQQSDPSLASIVTQRQANSIIESLPIRKISTPGKAGIGIAFELSKASHTFSAHVNCPHCGKLSSLHPEKCFLKPKLLPGSDGEPILTYYDEEMRIVDWHYSDENDKINSAFIACEHCKQPFSQEDLQTARLYDEKTKISVADFIETVNLEPNKFRKVALIASPFLRRVKTNIAARYVSSALDTQDPIDFVQQGLGLPTTESFSGLTLELVKAAIEAPKIPHNVELYEHRVLLGGDIARASHYFCVVDAYIPKMGTKESRYRNAIRSIRSFERSASYAIPALIKKHGVQFGAIDFNPDSSLTMALTKQFNLIGATQVHGLTDIFRDNKEFEAGGVKTIAYQFNNQHFINTVIKNFTKRSLINEEELIVRLADKYMSDVISPSPQSVVAHLIGLVFDEEKGMWIKPKNSRCDYFYSLLFAEVALYFEVNNRKDTSWLKFFK